MLHLRVFGDSAAMADVAQRLDALAGVRHVSIAEGVHGGDALVTADLRAAAADSQIEQTGRPLRQMMSWLNAPVDEAGE